jgi:hypothetical protein
MKEDETIIHIATCIDCDWAGDVGDCDDETDYDEFWGRMIHYPICPECCGGVEVNEIYKSK